MTRFADVSEDALCEAVDASVDILKKQLLQMHRRIKTAVRAQQQLQQDLKGNPDKFSIYTMKTGNIDEFHLGIRDRIGEY